MYERHREKICIGVVVAADCDMPSTSGFIPSHMHCDGDSSDGGVSDTDTQTVRVT